MRRSMKIVTWELTPLTIHCRETMSVESRAIIMDARRGGVLEERFCDLYGTGAVVMSSPLMTHQGAPPGHQESYCERPL